jgi:hypothetical protein
MNKQNTRKTKITKTIYDSVNHTPLPKEVLLPDWARREMQIKKCDRVQFVIR